MKTISIILLLALSLAVSGQKTIPSNKVGAPVSSAGVGKAQKPSDMPAKQQTPATTTTSYKPQTGKQNEPERKVINTTPSQHVRPSKDDYQHTTATTPAVGVPRPKPTTNPTQPGYKPEPKPVSKPTETVDDAVVVTRSVNRAARPTCAPSHSEAFCCTAVGVVYMPATITESNVFEFVNETDIPLSFYANCITSYDTKKSSRFNWLKRRSKPDDVIPPNSSISFQVAPNRYVAYVAKSEDADSPSRKFECRDIVKSDFANRKVVFR